MPATRPQLRLLAILTVRDEGPFLIDWVAHHLACGFTDLLVLSNDCRDGTDAMLDRMQALGHLTHLRNHGPFPKGPQWAALKLAEGHPLTARADWIMVLDVDEFVNVHVGDRTLTALLAALPDATAIPLSWRFFGNAGVVEPADRPVTETFTRAAPPAMAWPWRASMVKTLFRNDGSYRRLGIHRPRQPDPAGTAAQRWYDGSGRLLPAPIRKSGVFLAPGPDRFGLAQINHYALGAMADYLVKCDRGRANRDAAPFDMAYWVERNFADCGDDSILAIAPRSAPLRDALRADPVLGRLHRAAQDWRRRRFVSLLADESYRALFVRLLITPASRPLDAATATRLARLFAAAQVTPQVAAPGSSATAG